MISLPRKICVVTGSRAEFGLLRWLMREIAAEPLAQLQVIATGMHLAPEFGMTLHEITSEGFTVDDQIESQLASDTHVGMVKSLGLGLIGFADSFKRLTPDIVVVLGDRYEILAAAQAASLMGIPVAHLYGGEVTEGAVDDWIRHSITKASWWHFVATEKYRQRVIQLGEAPGRVFNVGAPGLDSLTGLQLLDRAALETELQLPLKSPLFLATYHPATLGDEPPEESIAKVLSAFDEFPQATVVLTRPNADAGSRGIAKIIDRWTEENTHRARCFTSLGQVRYLSLMKIADLVIGNSSSGIIEAPAMKVATVNIGPRQNGRLMASSILHCSEETSDIVAAIQTALSCGFQSGLPATVSAYGHSGASSKIKRLLLSESLPPNLRKVFHDV